MKKVSTLEFISIVKDLSARKAVSGTKSINGEFGNVTYLVSSVLKNGYYAKNQKDKNDKNPYWKESVTAIKEYNFQVAISYAKQREKDGYTLSEEESETPFISIVPNLIFQHKTTGAYYIQVMSKAHNSTFFLNGEPMSKEDKAILDRYAKPYDNTNLKSDDYKKLSLNKVLAISLNGETYTIDDTTYINVSKTTEKVVEVER